MADNDWCLELDIPAVEPDAEDSADECIELSISPADMARILAGEVL